MYNRQEKSLILQAFCDRFGVTKTEGKRILEQCEYEPFIAEKMMMSHKTKIEQTKKPERTIAELRKLKREPSSKQLAKQLLKRCRAVDRSRGIHDEKNMHSMVSVLKVALNQFPNNPKAQRDALRFAENGFKKPPASPQKAFQKEMLRRIAHVRNNRSRNE